MFNRYVMSSLGCVLLEHVLCLLLGGELPRICMFILRRTLFYLASQQAGLDSLKSRCFQTGFI